MTARFRIFVEDSGKHFDCNGEQRLLHAMQAQGFDLIPVGCKGGGCGVCRVQIIEGEYESRKMSRTHVSEAEEQQGYVLSCRVVPKSNLSLRLAPRPAQAEAEGAA